MRHHQDDKDYQRIGEMIKKRREEHGISQESFAKKLQQFAGTTTANRNIVSRWERGKRIPGPYWRAHISRATEIELATLERAARAARAAKINRLTQDNTAL